MIRNELFTDGVLIEAEVIDLDAGTVTIERGGKTIESRPLTDEERATYQPAPPSTEARIIALEDAITNASSLNDLKARVRAASR